MTADPVREITGDGTGHALPPLDPAAERTDTPEVAMPNPLTDDDMADPDGGPVSPELAAVTIDAWCRRDDTSRAEWIAWLRQTADLLEALPEVEPE